MAIFSVHPAADTSVWAFSPTRNQSDNPYLRAGRHHYWGVYRSLLRFDINRTMPVAQEHVREAELVWYQRWRAGPPLSLDVYGIAGSWRERDVNWVNQPASDPDPADSVDCPEARHTWVKFDVTDLVRAWAIGARPNYGLIVRSRNEDVPAISVAPSTRWGDRTVWPRLILRLSPAPPHPPVPPPHRVVTRDLGDFSSEDIQRATGAVDITGLEVLTVFVFHMAGWAVKVRLSYSPDCLKWFPDPASHVVGTGEVARLTPLHFARYLRAEYRSAEPGRPGTIRVVLQGTT